MLNGYVAIVTGASAGIGEATVRRLCAQGAKVVATARREERLAALVAEFGADAVVPVAADVRDPAAATRMVEAAVDVFGRLDGLIANAGMGYYGGIMDHDDARLTEMLETNIHGTIWPIRAAVPQMRAQGGGDIVIISSVAGTTARGNEAVYAATKHAQMGLAVGLDRELFREGIRVTALQPGGVVTEFARQEGGGRTATTPELADMLSADDVADAVAFVLNQPRTVRTRSVRLRGATEAE